MSAVDRRTTLARTVVQYVSEKFTDAMFETAIPSSVVVKNARNACQTVLDYAPRHKVADAYRALAREFEARLLSMSEVAMAAAAEA
jgi:chromosome partitioning protein